MSMLTPDFSWKMPGGQVLNLQQTETVFREMLATLVSITDISVNIKHPRAEGNKAIVEVDEKYKSVVIDSQGNTKKVVTTETFRDTWVRSDTGWKFQSAVTLKSDTVIDGQTAVTQE